MSQFVPPNTTASTISEVLKILAAIVAAAKIRKSRIGYFAAVYLRITQAVKAGISAGAFNDPAWVEQLDVTFANRYFGALRQFEYGGSGPELGRSWMVAFSSASMWRPIVLQHVLLGINAHINFDLGIATASMAGANLQTHYDDFVQVNTFAAGEVAQLQSRLACLSPLLGTFDFVNGTRADSTIVNFGIDRARDQAWEVAELLTYMPANRRDSELQVLDRNTANLARLVLDPPGAVPKLTLRLVRACEIYSVPTVIEHL